MDDTKKLFIVSRISIYSPLGINSHMVHCSHVSVFASPCLGVDDLCIPVNDF